MSDRWRSLPAKGDCVLPLLPRQTITDVRERTNIVDIVRRYVELKRAGPASWKGICPFHTEKTASFHVHEQRQFFHCFGCERHGDVIRFLQELEQRPFIEVVRELARDAGVELPERLSTPAERKAAAAAASERERMLLAVEEATQFFEAQLALPIGTPALRYVESRGISKQVRSRFRLGYAPGGWHSLQAHLSARQIPDALAEQVGLVGRNERGPYDFFRDRVMLPVLDRQGRPVGFSSRLLDPNAKDRKYLNSPDSPVFHKKANLYGLHAALPAIRRTGTVVVVEGNFDVLTLHKAGIEEAVAPMGTALTVEQMKILATVAKRIVVVFDGDAAGVRATEKSVALAVEAGLFFADADADGRVAEMPCGVDPDEFVRANGPDSFRALVARARPMLDYLIHRAADDATVPGKANAARRVVGVLAKLRNPLVRDLYIRDLAAKLGVPVAHLATMVRDESGQRAAVPVSSDTAIFPPTRRAFPPDEIDALALVIAHPELASSPLAPEALGMLRNPEVHQVFAAVLSSLQSGEPPNVPAWLDAAPGHIRGELAKAVMDGRWDEVPATHDALAAIVQRLRRSRIDEELAEARRLHREAIARGDNAEAQAIARREMELIRSKLRLGS
ncbi:MAG: DNA primase [Polyangiaceae bacterium]|nr:DNA primase [Polyangiaceae bacterium]